MMSNMLTEVRYVVQGTNMLSVRHGILGFIIGRTLLP